MALTFAAAAGACVSYLAYRRKFREAVDVDSSPTAVVNDDESIRHDAGQPKSGKRVAIVTGGSR